MPFYTTNPCSPTLNLARYSSGLATSTSSGGVSTLTSKTTSSNSLGESRRNRGSCLAAFIAESTAASTSGFVGYGYPMQPRSCFSPFFSLLMVTKTPYFSNSFSGVLHGALIHSPVLRYSLTAFRASSTSSFPSAAFNSYGKSFLPQHSATKRVPAVATFFSETVRLEFYRFFSYSFLSY